ncbi:hypothetical protein [Mycobacterium phage WXIN]|nr:hypothetical protein [Mycobacterium phage WXIN]
MIERINPDTPCAPNGAHHPHRWACFDPDCCGPECWEENGVGEPIWLGEQGIWCCICGENWPCKTKQQHVAERKERNAS